MLEFLLIMLSEAAHTWEVRCPDSEWKTAGDARTQIIFALWDLWDAKEDASLQKL